ncbi:uncharacterized protein LOC113279621 [Papaver somniferum]|uniref:uncharacterized protein LOC113279621 n=1 Tax=Papaver somniferum TaxID=3469 RepID=UPI000E6FBD33|nr:uncharacterized protein LOC113279621 [Papaver somniferum]
MPNKSFVPSVGRAGGLLLLWKDGFSFSIVHQDDKIFHTRIINNPNRGEWCLTCVYGTPYNHEKEAQWSLIQNLGRSINKPWVVIGDLNITFTPSDRNTDCNNITSNDFVDIIKDSDLTDLGFCGKPYTWPSNKHGTCRFKSRLDRALGNSEWFLVYPDSVLKHLHHYGSDHTPILLELSNKNRLSNTRHVFSLWIKITFGDFNKRITDLQSDLSSLQSADVNGSNTEEVIKLESEIRQLNEIEASSNRKKSRDHFYNDMDMNSRWAPGFYQTQCLVVKEDVCKTIQSFFHSGFLLQQLNNTRVSLIPKVQVVNKPEDFRPIALCNTVYKIISKIIALRLKKHIAKIISPMQSAYVPGRLISENICLVQEIVQAMKKKEGLSGHIALKMDMSKAFDRLEWSFLLDILKQFGFSDKFRQLISQCISTT